MYNVKELFEIFKDLMDRGQGEATVALAHLQTTHHLSNVGDVVEGMANPFMKKERQPVVVLDMAEEVWNDDEDFEAGDLPEKPTKGSMTEERWETIVSRLNSIGHGYDVRVLHTHVENGIELKMLDEEDNEICDALVTEAGEVEGKVIFRYADDQQECFVSSSMGIFALMYT